MNDSLDKDLREIEAQLASLNPSKMPDDMIARMEQAMISWESNLPVEEKIVQFDHTTTEVDTLVVERSSDKMHIWGAAAAIALVAGVASVFIGSSPSQDPGLAETSKNSVIPSPLPSISENSDIVTSHSSELSRNIIHASNEGVTYSDNNDEAFKVLRIEYTEKIITRDSKGNPVITEKPCLEHVLVPVPVH